MNRADVRKLLHIKESMGPWQVCSDFIYNSWKFQKEGSVFIYNMLKAAGIRVLIYSGDTDMMVATVGTEEWIDSLGWKVNKEWRQWMSKYGSSDD